MPTYFFHVRDGALLLEDKDGTELADLDAAISEARASAREIAADSLRSDEVIDGRTIEVADVTHAVLATVLIRDVIER